jgi:hypothetical protein
MRISPRMEGVAHLRRIGTQRSRSWTFQLQRQAFLTLLSRSPTPFPYGADLPTRFSSNLRVCVSLLRQLRNRDPVLQTCHPTHLSPPSYLSEEKMLYQLRFVKPGGDTTLLDYWIRHNLDLQRDFFLRSLIEKDKDSLI